MSVQSSGRGKSSNLRKDVRRGLTGAHLGVAQILYNLAKTARSFAFYARSNQTIGRFLEELHQGFAAFLEEEERVRLIVGGDRFIYDGEIVYFDADRENGLPFRLFRDGIRAIDFKVGLGESELETFLELLGRRQSRGKKAEEEDLVTLLWQQSFEHITYQGVEGFTHDLSAAGDLADGEDAVDSGQALPNMMDRISGRKKRLKVETERGQVARSYVGDAEDDILGESDLEGLDGNEMSLAAGLYPGSRDYPLQVPKGPVEVPYEAITDEELQALQDELEEENQRGLLYLLDYCFEVSRQMPQLLQPADFRPLLTPIRRYLIRGRDLETYDRLLRYLRKIAEGGIYPPALTEQAAEMLQECCELDALSAVVATASGDDVLEDIAWDILQQLLPDLAQRDVLVLLGHAMSEHMSNILAATLIQSTGADLGLYEEALEGESVAAALAGLRCLATLRTPKAVLLIEQAVWRPENLVKRGALRILGRVPPGETTPKALLKGLRDSDPEVRDEALDAVDRQAISDMASSVGRWFEEVGFSKMDEEKRLQFARILCDLDREYAANYFGDKIKINVLTKFGGATTAAEMEWNLLAAEGLALAATKGAIEKLREVRTKGDKKFRDRVTRLAVEARRRARE